MKIYDLNSYPLSDRNGTYGGLAGRKDGILINGERWMVKYPKITTGMRNVPISYTTSPLNEFIGSHVYEILGYPVHETILGIRKNKLVVACKDFCDDNSFLMEIRTIKNFANEQLAMRLDREFAGTGDSHVVNLNEILLHLKHNDILNAIQGAKERFWDMCVIDLYIKNGDRNNGNWGILRSRNCTDTLAPIFDNGGSFVDKADDEKYERDLQPTRIMDASTNFRTVYGMEMVPEKPESVKQLNAKDFIEHALQYPDFCTSISKNIPTIIKKEAEMNAFIEAIPNRVNDILVCTDIQKRYFIETMNMRLKYLLVPAYEKITGK